MIRRTGAATLGVVLVSVTIAPLDAVPQNVPAVAEMPPRPEGRQTFKEESLEVGRNPLLPPVSRAPP